MAKKKTKNTFIEIDYETEATPKAKTTDRSNYWATSSRRQAGDSL